MRALTANEVEVRVGTVNKNGVTMLLYKNARVDRAILDETFGQMNWQCRYSENKGNLFCSIGVYDPNKDEWVWKEDCGTESNTEKEKGEASDAFKRAGFRWGIGIELYNSPRITIPVAVEEVAKGVYKMKNKWELYGAFVSRMVVKDGKVTELDIAKTEYNKNTYVIWSTDKKREGITL